MSLEPFVSGETDEWATPPSFVRPIADSLGGFDLDPASGAERSPIADETISAEEDGLSQRWNGDVWLNPPYSDIGPWLRKAISEIEAGRARSVVALVKGDTSTDWFHHYGLQASTIAFIDDRLKFGNGSNDAPFPSIVLVYGEVPDEAIRTLQLEGTVIRHEVVDYGEQTTLTEKGDKAAEGER